MSPLGLDFSTNGTRLFAVPLTDRDEVGRHFVEALQQVGVRPARRVLEGQHLDVVVVQAEHAAVALQRRVGHLRIEERVLGEAPEPGLVRAVVEKTTEEAEGLGLAQHAWGDRVFELDDEGLDLGEQLLAGTLEVVIHEGQRAGRGQPVRQRGPRVAHRLRGPIHQAPSAAGPFVEHDEEEVEVVEIRTSSLQEVLSVAEGPVDHRVRMGLGRDRGPPLLDQVLQEPESVVEQPERRFESARHAVPLRRFQPLVVHAGHGQHHAHVPALGQEHLVVEESVEVQQTVHRARLPVAPEQLVTREHGGAS